MIRVVPTGDLGLDVLVGGGWRLVKRPERESATVVVRGGSGAGKTLLGFQVALELARALGGDVAVGCMEILPSEYIAQLGSARPGLPAERVTSLPLAPIAESGDEPRVFVGLLADLDPDEPDLVASLEALVRDVTAAGGKPVALIVDSLIEGYGVGSSAPRIHVDAVMKFAAQGGYGLVLCEEAVNDAPSPWVFAADTVLQLGVESRERGRWIEVRKHRFAPCASGRHELDIVGVEHPEVFPTPSAWMSPGIERVLVGQGWRLGEDDRPPHNNWNDGISVAKELSGAIGTLVFVSGADVVGSRTLAHALRPKAAEGRSLLVELDPLVVQPRQWTNPTDDGLYLPTASGAARALRRLIDQLGTGLRTHDHISTRCVVIGDLNAVLVDTDPHDWMEALRAFVSVVIAVRRRISVIAYDSGNRPGSDASLRLAAHADVVVEIRPGMKVWIDQKWPRETHEHQLKTGFKPVVRLDRGKRA